METVKLGDVARSGYGLTSSAIKDHTGFRFLRITDIVNGTPGSYQSTPYVDADRAEVAKYALDRGDILVARTGATVGTAHWFRGWADPVLFASYLVRFVADPTVADSRFLFYTLQSHSWREHVRAHAFAKSAQPNMSATVMSEYEFLLPSLNEQIRVASVLGSLDDKIAANHEAVGLAEQLIDALIYEQISAGDFVNIGGELILHYGNGLPASKRLPGEVPVVGSGGVVGRHSSPLLEGPTIVVGRKGSIGALHWLKGPSFPIDTTFWVESKRLPARILFSLLKRVDFSGANTDSAVPGLNRSVAYEMPMPYISDESVSGVLEEVDALDALCSQKEQENVTLANTRDELLPLLMNGKISVREAKQEATSAGADIPSEEIEA